MRRHRGRQRPTVFSRLDCWAGKPSQLLQVLLVPAKPLGDSEAASTGLRRRGSSPSVLVQDSHVFSPSGLLGSPRHVSVTSVRTLGSMCRPSASCGLSSREASVVYRFSSEPPQGIFVLSACSPTVAFLSARVRTTACRYWFRSLVLVGQQRVNGRSTVPSGRTHSGLTARERDTRGLHSDRSLFGIGHRVGSHATKWPPCIVYIACDCRSR